MKTENAMGQPISRLRVLDADLPLLASHAAIELENIIQDVDREFDAMRQLAERLANSVQTDQRTAAFRSLMDPPTTVILNNALVASKLPAKTTSEQLAQVAQEIASQLQQLPTQTKLEHDHLARLRDFCLAISSLTAAYQRSILDLRPTHPFRKIQV
jgi:hypothetical protein